MIEVYILSITAFTITIANLIYIHQKRTQIRKDVIKDINMICMDLKTILNDVELGSDPNNAYDPEEAYEVDASLMSYFDDNMAKIQQLIIRLQDVRTGFLSKKDEKLSEFGDLLSWTINVFYRRQYEEDERIRIWSKNIPEFHKKMTKTLAQIQ